MMLHDILPKLGKVMAILLCRIIHLNNPKWHAALNKALIIVRRQCNRLGLDLCDKSWVGIVMFSFFWGTDNLPSLDYLIKLALALDAARVFVRMILQNESLVFLLQLSVSRTRVDLKSFIIILLAFKFKFAQAGIYLSLVLENAET